jgi:prepilin-type N-terminal cleavage/methylation domain-containing protein
MTRAQRISSAAGFTLVELLVTMAVIGIVSSVTAVNVVREIPRYRLTNAASQLAWTFRALRMRAISQHHAVTVTFANTHVYTVWTDRNTNGSMDSGEVQTVDIHGAYPGVQLASTTNPTFNATGTVTNVPTITLTNPSGTKTLTMNILGDVTIQ